MNDQGAVDSLGEAGASVCGKRTHARAKFERGGWVRTAIYSTPGSRKRRQNRRIIRSVGVCLFAYTRAGQAMIPGRQDGLFVRQAWLATMRLDYARIQAIARNQQASKARSTCLAVFRRRQAWIRFGQDRSLKRISHECDGRYPGRSGCTIVSCRSVVTGDFRNGPTIAGSWTVARRVNRLLGGA